MGARYLVTGSFRQDRDSSAVTLQLIRSKDGALVWAEKFAQPAHWKSFETRSCERSLTRSDSRREGLRTAFPSIPRDHSTPPATTRTRSTCGAPQSLRSAVRASAKAFASSEGALALDSTSAEAWSGLSLALAISAVNQDASVDSVRPEAIASAKQAMRLDSTLSGPHVAIGVVHALDWNGRKPSGSSEGAALNPQDLEARIHYTRVLFGQGRFAAAHQQIDSARETDPASSLLMGFKASAYAQGDTKSALTWSDRAMGIDSTNYVVVASPGGCCSFA